MTAEGDEEMTDAQPVAAWPGWSWWTGVNGMTYARCRIDLANVTVRAHNFTALLGRIRATEAKRGAGG